LIKRGREKKNGNNGTYLIIWISIFTPRTTNNCARTISIDVHPTTTLLFIDQREPKKCIKKICRDTRNMTFIHKKKLQEEDVEMDEKKEE
jgi:hypothetical protein